MIKYFKYTLYVILAILAVAVAYALINFPPLMAGMAAKTMCSCRYVTGRTEQSVREEELTVFPGLPDTEITFNPDSSVSAHVLGRTRTAIYRKGLGCTLLAQHSAEELRAQKFKLPSVPLRNQDTIDWPDGNRIAPNDFPGMNYGTIRDAIDSSFIDVDPSKPVLTHGVVVVYDGVIVGEHYAPGFSKDSRLMGWSMTKSVTNALIGLLVKDGKLDANNPAPVSEWKDDERKAITLNNLLQASSGLEWDESYLLPGDFHNMFMDSDDKGAYAASKQLQYKPNEHFQYSSGTTNILSRIVRQQVGDAEYFKFPYERLFYKIGMDRAMMEPDASGTFVGSSYCYATARDWARFGLLYLNDGVWGNERILPEGWVKYSATPATTSARQEYGAQWWLNAGEKGNPSNCNIPGIPSDALIAEGFERQYVVIIPSKKLIVVRLGVTHHGNFKIEKLIQGVLRGLPQE